MIVLACLARNVSRGRAELLDRKANNGGSYKKLIMIFAFASAASLGPALADDRSEAMYLPQHAPEVPMSGCQYSRTTVPAGDHIEWRIVGSCS